jgi:hypothetical protein
MDTYTEIPGAVEARALQVIALLGKHGAVRRTEVAEALDCSLMLTDMAVAEIRDNPEYYGGQILGGRGGQPYVFYDGVRNLSADEQELFHLTAETLMASLRTSSARFASQGKFVLKSTALSSSFRRTYRGIPRDLVNISERADEMLEGLRAVA